MPYSSYAFDDVSRQVCHLKDVVLWDIQRGFDKESGDSDEVGFNHHMVATKYWYVRISSRNKALFILVLLEEIKKSWTLSLLLKSIWNCYPKDAVASSFESPVWSGYDQVPLDHNRAAKPIEALVSVMEADRKWFRTLGPYRQSEFLSELLTISGGPIVWAVFHRAQVIFENYREDQLQNIHTCMTDHNLTDSKLGEVKSQSQAMYQRGTLGGDKSKTDTKPKPGDDGLPPKQADSQREAKTDSKLKPDDAAPSKPSDAQRQLQGYLDQWNGMIKAMKDSLKLEELELSLGDGSKRRIWKVNRPEPEAIETVDYIQLLPLSVAKRILMFVPQEQLNDCARVNKYWAFLVEDFKAEIAARLKIDIDIQKLTDEMLRHDPCDASLETFQTMATNVSYSIHFSKVLRRPACSQRPSQKSAATCVFKGVLRDSKKKRITLPPIRNLAQMSERLDRRGAIDEEVWNWCRNVLCQYNHTNLGKGSLRPVPITKRLTADGIMVFGNIHFPCPLMSMTVSIPLKPPLCKDPTTVTHIKKKKKTLKMSEAKYIDNRQENETGKRFSIWSHDFSTLYSASKIPCYKSLNP